MKNLIILIFITITFFGCKEAVNEPKVEIIQNLVPVNEGSVYKYSYVENDSAGATIENGERVTRIIGSNTRINTQYFIQRDSFYLSTSSSSETNIRKTNAGVYYFVDTTGFSSQIPDTILNLITIDPELIYLSLPLTEPRQWSVYRVLLNIQSIALPLIEFNGRFVGKENLTLTINNESKNYECFKIRYELTIRIPDLSNNSFTTESYSAHSWFAEEVGLIKSEGSPIIVRGFDLSNLDLENANRTSVQILTSYQF